MIGHSVLTRQNAKPCKSINEQLELQEKLRIKCWEDLVIKLVVDKGKIVCCVGGWGVSPVPALCLPLIRIMSTICLFSSVLSG